MIPLEIYITWPLLSALSITVDSLIGHTGEITLLHFEEPGMQMTDVIIEIMLAPSFGIIFANFMPKNRNQFIKYFIYWVAFSTFYEWFAVKIDFLVYNGWKLWYSTIIYILTFLFIRWHLHFISGVRNLPKRLT
ncbi:CBO0543 family protein [Ammoniphilus sp. 3BR4]|uniref:CBO0543 family protein n=1 Tax=Ammoniphilus sp. 3BR4 TaxID=3158265 RepID=UPI003464F862